MILAIHHVGRSVPDLNIVEIYEIRDPSVPGIV